MLAKIDMALSYTRARQQTSTKFSTSLPVDDIKRAISGLGAGNPSIARDFLDPKKTAGVSISRKLGERRVATIIFLSKLPTDIQDKLKQGMSIYIIPSGPSYELTAHPPHTPKNNSG